VYFSIFFWRHSECALKQGDKEKALELINWYKNTYGKENFFIEITHHPEISGHEENMKKLLDLARETGHSNSRCSRCVLFKRRRQIGPQDSYVYPE
jgi:DNA polymerase III alpha subunit